MKEKEARDYKSKHEATSLECECRDGELDMECYRALGYLEAIEKAEVLVEALKKINVESYEENEEQNIDLSDLEISYIEDIRIAREALAKWEKEK